jgi:hypothetical protein
MKQLFTPCAIILLLGASCQKSSVSLVNRKPMSALHLQAAAATAVNSKYDMDLAADGFVAFSACNGDALQIVSGIEKFDLHETINGNNISVDQHTNMQNFKLVDLTTGARYSGSSTSHQNNNYSLTDGKLALTQTESVLLTTPGGKNNSEIKFDVHETIDAKGNITTFIDNYRAGCK